LGRHQRPGGYERDLEKYNLAISEGWQVVRFTPQMIQRDPWGCAELVKRILTEEGKYDESRVTSRG
jgi:very-short-patch-repair endonuclease